MFSLDRMKKIKGNKHECNYGTNGFDGITNRN